MTKKQTFMLIFVSVESEIFHDIIIKIISSIHWNLLIKIAKISYRMLTGTFQIRT